VWVYLPSVCLAEPAGLTLPPNDAELGPSAMSSGTDTPKPSLCRECGTKHLTMLPCGTMLQPSTASRGVGRWILSLEDSLASPIALLESGRGQQTKETFGPIQCESCKSPGHGDSSEKTSQELLPMDLPRKSWQTLNQRVIAGLPFTIPLAPLVPHTCGKECSLWPTPSASDWKGSRTPEALAAAGRNERNNLRDFLRWKNGSIYPHPSLVEKMMGWKIGQTALDAQAMEWFQAKQSRPSKNSKRGRE
jgi:hypothetical protein